jgi:chromosome segregation ATPase
MSNDKPLSLVKVETSDDPDVARVLENISGIRHERDVLKLDLEKSMRDLAVADGKIAYLQRRLDEMQRQRDHFMGKLIEVMTNFQTIKGAVEAIERAANSSVQVGKIAADAARDLKRSS